MNSVNMKFKVYYTIAGFFTLDVDTREDADAAVDDMTVHDLLALSGNRSVEIEIEDATADVMP